MRKLITLTISKKNIFCYDVCNKNEIDDEITGRKESDVYRKFKLFIFIFFLINKHNQKITSIWKTKDDNKVFIKTNISVVSFERPLTLMEGDDRHISFHENLVVIFRFP